MRNQSLDARPLLLWKVEVHVRSIQLQLAQKLWRRCSKHIVYLLNLIHLILARKERKECNNLKADAPCSKHVHLEVIVPIREQTLRSTVPSCADVLGIRLARIDSSATPKICKLDVVVKKEQVLGFDISVEDSIPVHVVQCLQGSVHIVLHLLFRQVVPPALDSFVQVHVHELKNKGQATRRFIIQHFMQLDDVRMSCEASERLNFPQVVHLVNAIEVVLHALDSNILSRFD
mmetsp:Transcript_32346/g.71678  ORF Transcript_32346/g.71678 Transcript_32346/m.71678 type:complete len:232 (-) Transcript_32346:217-912(-)